MLVTVEQIAKTLSMSDEDAIMFLHERGIKVLSSKSTLSSEDMNLLRLAIEKAKKDREKKDRELEERGLKNLEYCIENYKVFIDTCSLLFEQSDKFWFYACPILKRTGNKVIISTRVIDELKKHTNNLAKPELSNKSLKTLNLLKKLIADDLVEVRGEETDNFADNVFQVVFTKFRMTHKLLLITQDTNLAFDINNLNNIKSVRANHVYVKKINRYGFLSNFIFDGTQTYSVEKQSGKNTVTSNVVSDSTPDREKKFKLTSTLTNIPEERLPVSSMPIEGECVYSEDGREIQLIKAVASGGEGSIYTTNTSYVAKVYKSDKLDKRKYEKIKLMLSQAIQCEGICYPIACLYNKNKQFIGYLMPIARGKELQKSLFIKPLLLKNFPDWKKRDTVELCVTILEKIKYLHDRNIIIGDINPANILVVSPKEVYFVDTDSYQIEGFPCPVGTINYTAPEIQRKNFASFLRTFGNENFAVATLLFMIMLPGKPPYSQQGGENPIDNIINMDFSYPFGEQSNRKTPDGPWRFIWSHLTYDIKESFYQTFRKNGEKSEENNRLSVNEWLSKFKHYLHLLDSGKLGEQDKMSEEIFPNRHKKNSKLTYKKCKLCQREIPEDTCKNGICRECLSKGEVYRCSRCGREMLYNNYQKYIKETPKHEICKECHDISNTVYSREKCMSCGRVFEITNGQYEFYKSKNLTLPKRCDPCRKNRQTSGGGVSNTSRPVPTTGGHAKGGSLCFITTAVCEYLGKTDDCYELMTLRQFRDQWLNYQADGPDLIEEYYSIAPIIVSKLELSCEKDKVYNQLWIQYIKPCVYLIENNEYIQCKELYMLMVNYLKDHFLV